MAKNTNGSAVHAALRALESAGDPIVRIHDGEIWHTPNGGREAMDLVLDLDEARLRTMSGATLFVAPFEEPVDQIVDYSLTVGDIIDPVIDRYNV